MASAASARPRRPCPGLRRYADARRVPGRAPGCQSRVAATAAKITAEGLAL